MATERFTAEEFLKNPVLFCQTDPTWAEKVFSNFNLFLADHASNERKAAAAAMLLVAQYPDRVSLVKTAARIAQDEMNHFLQVFELLLEHGGKLTPDEKDPYTNELLSHVRSSGEERLLDRLLVHSLVEYRGWEKFLLLKQKHDEEKWKNFFDELAKSEMGHGASFLKEALRIFPATVVTERLKEFLKFEATAMERLVVTHRFH